MTEIVIRACRAADIAVMARTLRDDDRAEIEDAGLPVKHFLFRLYVDSLYRRAALVDGEIAAIWGDCAPLLSTEGHVWLLTAPPIERIPLTFFREARREIGELLRLRSLLRADTGAGYHKAHRFFALLGFQVLSLGSDGSAARREIVIRRKD